MFYLTFIWPEIKSIRQH